MTENVGFLIESESVRQHEQLFCDLRLTWTIFSKTTPLYSTSRTPIIKSAERLRNVMKLRKQMISRTLCFYLYRYYLYKCGAPAVCVNAWMGFFGCVNAWKWRKIAWMRELKKLAWIWKSTSWLRECVNLPYFCVNTWIFPFSPIFKYFPNLSEKFSRFPKKSGLRFAWISRKICVNAWIAKKNCVNAWILGPLGGPQVSAQQAKKYVYNH